MGAPRGNEGRTMDQIGSDTLFAGSVPELYDTHMVPLIFAPVSYTHLTLPTILRV